MFIKSIFLLAAATAVLGKSAKIIGGTPAALGEIPFVVSIQDRDGQHYCGGVIVGPTTVITAASCIAGIQQLSVVAGFVDLASPGTVHRPQAIIVHPDFAIEGSIPHRDIAVINVQTPFPSDTVTGRAFMPLQDFQVPADLECTTAGWGTTSLGGVSSDVLLKVQVPTLNTTVCEEIYSDIHVLADDQVCAGLGEGGADACDRDVGGPLFRSGVVYGLFSWGGACGQPGRPGVYVDVATYRDWIDANSILV